MQIKSSIPSVESSANIPSHSRRASANGSSRVKMSLYHRLKMSRTFRPGQWLTLPRAVLLSPHSPAFPTFADLSGG